MQQTVDFRSFVPASTVGVLESPDEVLSTLTRDGKRKWMYPTPSGGRYEKRRRMTAWLLIALFIALPIIPVNGRPAILLDVLSREFAFFGMVLYPTDTILGLFFMLAVMVSVFLFTALFGRVWCGWACPQTVYLEFVYRPIERWIEGSEIVRRRRDDGPWTQEKVRVKALKWGSYGLISVALAHVFVAYFAGWSNLLRWMQQPPTEHWGYFILMAFTTALVLFNFGVFREQMCTIACPYARLQSVLLDPDSLIVSYDPVRGEPRARRSNKEMAREAAGQTPVLGDCIDCGACVRTCPMGIDIRDGLQMECTACTQCVDACDEIMLRIGKPDGLIRYTSENELAGAPARRVRPRTLIYSGLLLALATGFTLLIFSRGAYDVSVTRTAGAPFVELPDGSIANRLRIGVRSQRAESSTFTVEAIEPLGTRATIVGVSPVPIEAGEMKHVEAWFAAPREAFQEGSAETVVRITFGDGAVEDRPFVLLGPSR